MIQEPLHWLIGLASKEDYRNDIFVAPKLGVGQNHHDLRVMARHYQSKITDTALRRCVQGSFGDLGPGDLAIDEWRSLGLALPDMDAMRAYRLDRVREQLQKRDVAGALLTDPINVRYATDSTNMQVWCTHNAVPYAFVATEGPVILFDFHGSAHLSDHLPLADEVRAGQAFAYFFTGDGSADAAGRFAAPRCKPISSPASPNRTSGPISTPRISDAAASVSKPGCWHPASELTPWFHECSSRVIEAGDIVAFDTNLIGPYGYCADVSRTWQCPGGEAPTSRQTSMYQLAAE